MYRYWCIPNLDSDEGDLKITILCVCVCSHAAKEGQAGCRWWTAKRGQVGILNDFHSEGTVNTETLLTFVLYLFLKSHQQLLQ